MKKQVMAAIDGSVFSSNSIDYLIRMFNDDPSVHLHLFAVVSEAGGGKSWMYDVDPLREHSPLSEKRRITAERFLRDAVSRLSRNGIAEERVTFAVEITTLPPAKAIHHEANRGTYDALVIGRRGVGKVGEFFFGSVSAFIVEHCRDIPLWIIDGEITSDRFLLAVHCKPQSLMAADHLAFITGAHPNTEIFLYHSRVLFGLEEIAQPEEFYDTWGREWCDKYLDPENYLFYAHAQVLKEHGISPKQITQLPMERNLNVSRDLINQARRHKCGTIVIGRRPKEAVKGIFGGVSDRVLNQAQNLALWLVS